MFHEEALYQVYVPLPLPFGDSHACCHVPGTTWFSWYWQHILCVPRRKFTRLLCVRHVGSKHWPTSVSRLSGGIRCMFSFRLHFIFL